MEPIVKNTSDLGTERSTPSSNYSKEGDIRGSYQILILKTLRMCEPEWASGSVEHYGGSV